MKVDYGLFVHVSVRKGTGPDAVLVADGVAPIRNAYALEHDVAVALERLRKELAAEALRVEAEIRSDASAALTAGGPSSRPVRTGSVGKSRSRSAPAVSVVVPSSGGES